MDTVHMFSDLLAQVCWLEQNRIWNQRLVKYGLKRKTIVTQELCKVIKVLKLQAHLMLCWQLIVNCTHSELKIKVHHTH